MAQGCCSRKGALLNGLSVLLSLCACGLLLALLGSATQQHDRGQTPTEENGGAPSSGAPQPLVPPRLAPGPSSPPPPLISPMPLPASCTGPDADLAVDDRIVRQTVHADFVNSTDPCLIDEGCLLGTGVRRVLRFSTLIANLGCSDFTVGSAGFNSKASGQRAGELPAGSPGAALPGWSWHTCHRHWHFDDYAHYSLRGFCNGSELVWEDRPVLGHKNGWCVQDLSTFGFNVSDFVYDGSLLLTQNISTPGRLATQWRSGGRPSQCANKFDCFHMGISSGCLDVYDHFLPCQWIDITETSPGEYWLTIDVNWNAMHRRYTTPENDYRNNRVQVPIKLATDGSVSVLSESEVVAIQVASCARL